MVPAAIKLLRSCGILAVLGSVAVWLGNLCLLAGFPIWNGVMSTGLITGGPATDTKFPCASMVVPCGIDAMRTTVFPKFGTLVAGTCIQIPGSTWMPTLSPWIVTSLMVCK